MTDSSQSARHAELAAPGASGRSNPPAFVRATLAYVAYAACYYLAYRYGNSFSQSTASPFWFPDSVLLCALLIAPARWWWVLVLGALPIRLTLSAASELPLWFLLFAFVIDTAKGVVAAWLLRRLLADPLNLRTAREFTLYFLIAVLLVPAAAAFGGAVARSMLDHDFWMSWQQWFLGNVLAQVVVTPAVLWGLPSARRVLEDSRPRRWIEALLVMGGLIVSTYVAFESVPGASGFAEPRFYMPVPFLFWAALRFGMSGASVAILITAGMAVEAAIAGHGPFIGQSPYDTALALQQFLLLRAAPLYIVAILFEQKQAAEQALVASERRFREVVESQTELVCRFLPDGTLSFVNESFCHAFQRSREGVLRSDFVALLPGPVHEIARAQIARAALQQERGEWECQVERPDRAIRWWHWLCHPIVGPRGAIEEFQAIGQDITDRKRAEEANRNLTHASRVAVVGELTAMVAHEINQPLAAILSNADAAEMLLDRTDPPLGEIREILAHIKRSDLRASEAVLRVRALLRKQEIHLQPMDLNDTILDVLRLAAADLRRQEVTVCNELSQSQPPVAGDPVHLQQVLLNLVINAMDAMKDTPVPNRVLTIRTSCVGREAVEVVVADRGHGIPPDQLAGIFESFFTTKTDGLGLGLSIASSIVKAHRGRIWAENVPDGGAAFHFILNVAAEIV